ncbi:hypothetical protein GS446_16390 [Rhodococcus hoagii]|nr:hypothetical protein [Prescottella equi]
MIDNTAHASGSGVTRAETPAVAGVSVRADGTDTVISAGGATVVVHHRPADVEPNGPVLQGEWGGGRGVFASMR